MIRILICSAALVALVETPAMSEVGKVRSGSVVTVDIANHDEPLRHPESVQNDIRERSDRNSDMAIKLAFIACMISAEDHCSEEQILTVEGTILGCLVNAQAKLAEWRHQHPEWQIKEYSCRYTHSAESDP